MTIAIATQARAADLAAPVVVPVVPVIEPFNVFNGIELHVQGEAGILGNAANPSQGANQDGYNFGHLYTDHANEVQLNQILMTITKPDRSERNRLCVRVHRTGPVWFGYAHQPLPGDRHVFPGLAA